LTWKRRNLRALGIQGCRSIPAADGALIPVTAVGDLKTHAIIKIARVGRYEIETPELIDSQQRINVTHVLFGFC
jgi:hypothetical protein